MLDDKPFKGVENRGRVKQNPKNPAKPIRTGKLWQKQRGVWTLIHTGLHEPDPRSIAEVERLAAAAGIEMPAWSKLRSGCLDTNGKPMGALVGAVVFTEDVVPEAITDPRERPWVNPEAGYCWRVRKSVTFDRHIPCPGLNGFFAPVPEAHVLAAAELRGLDPT